MGGGMEIGTLLAGQNALGSIASGKAQAQAYEMEAQQATMQAEMDEIQRRRDLNDALAMQAVMFAAQGRAAGVGSTGAIVRGDMERAQEDINLIRAGGKSRSAGLRAAGRQAKVSGYSSALAGGAKDMMSLYQAGAFSGSDTKKGE